MEPIEKTDIAILGGGPAGLMLAYKLLLQSDSWLTITIIEKNSFPGGIASSFQEDGIWLDLGSHRLHPSTPEHLLDSIQTITGSSFLIRKRNGRIRLLGRYLKFPLKPLDCLFHLPLSFTFGVLIDLISKPFRPKTKATTFGQSLLGGLGKTVCNTFYFPYCQKLWGYPPDEIDIEQARKRVSASSIGKIVKKMIGFLPGLKSKKTGIFYYFQKGIGQLSEKLAEQVKKQGGEIRYSTEAVSFLTDNDSIKSLLVQTSGGEKKSIQADYIFSTIPITRLIDMMASPKPESVTKAASHLSYRNMVLFYLVMGCEQWQTFDAHYFPEEEFIFSRISEGKNYNGADKPTDRTIICCEIPCEQNDEIWRADDEKLKRRVVDDLEKAGIPARDIIRVFSKRVPSVYPVYRIGYPDHLATVENYLGKIENLITFGRQGLFTHDNIHHTMMMADRAATCFDRDGQWNRQRWDTFSEEFAAYVVED